MTSNAYEVQPVTGPVNGSVLPPGSKSLTNRALVVAALARGESRLSNVLDSQDTRVMLESCRRLGVAVEHDPATCTVKVPGCGGRFPANDADLWLENSGTSIRFLTAACTLGEGRFKLDGNARMRQRPILDLVQALHELGADVRCATDSGCPPVEIIANGLPGGRATVAANISSQYLSALLMAAPCAKSPVVLQIAGGLVSEPYIDMTLGVMKRFGVSVTRGDPGLSTQYSVSSTQYSVPGTQAVLGTEYSVLSTQSVPGTQSAPSCQSVLSTRYSVLSTQPSGYRGTDYVIEPDASAASYFFAAAAITGGTVTVMGLGRDSMQGDLNFVHALALMGCDVVIAEDRTIVHGEELCGIEIDMNAISDTAQTLAAVAVFAKGPTTIRNIAHVRHKETDRIAAVVTELKRLGLQADEHADGLTIHPGIPQPATIETYDDHRMAMSFSLIGLKAPGIRIANPSCTAKTYPNYFADLERLCGR